VKGVSDSKWRRIFIEKMLRVPGLRTCFRRFTFSSISYSYDVIINYIESHKHALYMLENSPKNPFVEKIVTEISGLIEEAEVELKKQIEAVFPEVCQAVNQRRAEFYVISQQIKFV
jgi:hypothetical protein